MAKRLEDTPFHLVASHNQDTSSRGEVTSYLRANGLSSHTPNFTITKRGRHPAVRGNGFVPYYAVFDHRGRLIHHHMCGSYHGGDGWKMIEWVDRLLKEAPALYLGEEPFEKTAALAKKIASGRGLASAVKKLEKQRAASPDAGTKAELDRLHAAVVRHRDRGLTRAEGLVGTQPSEVLPRLKAVQKQFAGTALAAEVDAKIQEWTASTDLKAAIAIEKKFAKIVRGFEKVKESKRTDVLIARTVKKLEALIAGHEDLPIAKTVESYLSVLR